MQQSWARILAFLTCDMDFLVQGGGVAWNSDSLPIDPKLRTLRLQFFVFKRIETQVAEKRVWSHSWLIFQNRWDDFAQITSSSHLFIWCNFEQFFQCYSMNALLLKIGIRKKIGAWLADHELSWWWLSYSWMFVAFDNYLCRTVTISIYSGQLEQAWISGSNGELQTRKHS